MSEIQIGGKPKLSGLPPRQLQVFIFIEREIDDKGQSPTLQEIADANEMQIAQAAQIVRELVAKGKLTSMPHKSRSIELVK